MGTRNLTMVIHNEQTKVAQYGQWDGYPSGQGVTALNFLLSADLEKFKQQLEKVSFFTEQDEKDYTAFCESIGAKDGWVNMEQSRQINIQYPFISRDHGAGILEEIYKAEQDRILITDSSDFLEDTLFCEYAYKIDLDKNEFTVFDSGTPVKVYKLDNLPTAEEFIKELEGVEEEEED